MKTVILTAAAIIGSVSFLPAQENKIDEQAITNVVQTMETGWKEKNGEKFASGFADTHDFIVWNGYYFRNTTRQQTAASHQGLFNGPFKMQDVKLNIDKIKFIRPDIALIHTLGVMYTKGTEVPKDPGVLMTLLMEKKDGKWQIISFHNLDLETFENKEIGDRSPIPLQVMYASWYKK